MKPKFAFVEFAEVKQAAEAIRQMKSRKKNKMVIEPAIQKNQNKKEVSSK